MTSMDRSPRTPADAARELNASDPHNVYGPGCEKYLGLYRVDCLCRSCERHRTVVYGTPAYKAMMIRGASPTADIDSDAR